MEAYDWKCTQEALKGLEKSLGCGVCNNPLQEPCTLGSCDHLFCRSCTKAHLGNSCPICQAPAWVKDLQLKRELASVVTLYNKLCSIINQDGERVNETAGQNEAEVEKVTPEVLLEEQGIPRKALHPRNFSEKASAAGKRKLIKNCVENSSKELVIGKKRNQLNKRNEKCAIMQKNEKNKVVSGSSSSENDLIDPMSVFEFIPSPLRPKPTKKRVRKPNPKTVKRQRVAAANRRWLKGHKGEQSKEVRGSDLESSLRHVSFFVDTDRSQTSSCHDSSSLESMDITSQDEDQSQLIANINGSKTMEEAPASTQESGYSTGSFKDTLSLEGQSHPPARNTNECSSKVQNSKPSCDPSGQLSFDDPCGPVQHLKDNVRRSQRKSKCSFSTPSGDICAEGLQLRNGRKDKNTVEEQQTVSRKTRSIIHNSDQLPAGEEISNLDESTVMMTDQPVTSSRLPERRLTRGNSSNSTTSLLSKENNNKLANHKPPPRRTRSRSSRSVSNTQQKDALMSQTRKQLPLKETGSLPDDSARDNSPCEIAYQPRTKSRSVNQDSRKRSPVTQTSRRKAGTGCLEEAAEGSLGEKGGPDSSEKSSRSSTSPRSGSAVKRNKRGETPLHVAVIKGDIVTAKRLLQEGADPNSMDNARWTPLHEACNHGHTALVAVLLDHGALINTPGFEHDSPLHDAVMNHRLDVVKLLLERGASLDVRNMHGLTPADYAKSEHMRAALKTQRLIDVVTKTTLPMSSRPSVLSRQQPVVLLGTGLNDSQRKRLQACAKLLGNGRVVSEFGSEVTHLVASCNHDNLCMRTMKYLNAVLRGVWVVSFNWITECLRIKDQAEELRFEVKGTTTLSNSIGAQKGRQNAEQQLPGLLDGCHFFLQSTFSPPTPSKKEIVQLIRNGGGTLLSRQPKPDDDIIQASTTVPYHTRLGSELATCSYYIIHDHVDSRAPPRVRTGKLCTAPISWLMDCISQFELLDLPN